jgi:hypothetical protein
MLWNSLMKKPILVMGILMLIVVAYQAKKNRPWGLFHNEKLLPTSCQAVLVKLKKAIPKNWNAFCEKSNLAIEIVETEVKDPTQIKRQLYRLLANDLIYIAQNSPQDSLERVDFVRVKLIHPQIELNALTEGKYLIKLTELTSQNLISDHLQATVKIQEVDKSH